MNTYKFEQISLRGRVAFAIVCFEKALINLKYDLRDWEIVLNYLWQFTNSNNLEDCNTIANELIPEHVLEFKDYEKHCFELLSNEEFKILFQLYQNIDELINILLFKIHELGASHAYGSISGVGESSLRSLHGIIGAMEENNIPLPSINPFLKFSIEENKGWGNLFERKDVFIIFD